MDTAAYLVQLEQSLHSPALRSDPAAASHLLAENFREFGASGRVFSRREILDEMAAERGRATAHPITASDFACHFLAPGLALLTYVSTSPVRRARRSSLWQREDGIWRIVFHQGTPIPG